MTLRTDSKKQHIPQVDYIRAIASLAVALYHLGGKVLPVLKYGWLGVEMFFVLSGYIICYAMPAGYQLRNSGRFIWRRLVRIDPPYLISIVLLLFLNVLTVAGYVVNWPDVLMHFAYLNNFLHREYLNPVYWTLGIEFQFYLLIALIFPLFNGHWGQLALLLCCIVLSLPFIPEIGLPGFFSFFALGINWFLYASRKINIRWLIILCIIFIVIAWLKSGLLLTCAGVMALVVLMLPLQTNRVVAFLARISFSLYLTHDIVGSRIVVYLGMLWPKTVLYKGIEFISGIVVSLLFAWLFNLAVERPFFRLAKRIKY